jgi:apolipoprotein D and lipocalin family protein
MRACIPLLCLLSGLGCARSTSRLAPVDGFDLERYSGRWYEIARFPHRFERGLVAVTAEYRIRDDGAVRVINRGFDPDAGEWQTAKGTARLKGDPDVGLLRVTFFWPFYGTYKIIRLDKEDYSYAVVTSDTYDYFWILARTPTLDADLLDSLLQFARESGFDVSRIEFPDQTKNFPAK